MAGRFNNLPKNLMVVLRNNLINESMDTGVFSMSLHVGDLMVSKAFYEKLGFQTFSGSVEVDYLVMKKGCNVLKLYQLFEWENYENNYLTLNPDWEDTLHTKEKLEDFGEIKNALLKQGIEIETSNQLQDPDVSSFFIRDPDGNRIFVEEVGI